MHTTRIPGNSDTEHSFLIPARPEGDAAEIAALRAEGLELLKLESVRELDEQERMQLVELSDKLFALGSRLPDNH